MKELWQTIANSIQIATVSTFDIQSIEAVRGGDINQSYRIQDDSQVYFVKIHNSQNTDMFNKEVTGLNAIADTNAIRVPKVITTGNHAKHSFLVLEFIALSSVGNISDFAQSLAKMHHSKKKQFGFNVDNYIGTTTQPNGWQDNWVVFYTEQRILHQLSLLRQKGAPLALLNIGETLAKNISCFFENYVATPSLIHGDLWQGNYGFDAESNPVLYDPACYYSDHEAELAMLELFGKPGKNFFITYNNNFAINAGYSDRKNLYNLYHILNHANLFGGSYVSQAESMIVHLLSKI